MDYQNTENFANHLDKIDPLRDFRNYFLIPQKNSQETIYFCGNSLGLQPKSAKTYIDKELEKWENLAVEGHFKGENPWLYYHKLLTKPSAKLVGAMPSEVVVMNNLTVNLHLMLVSFYQPTSKKFKILMEGGAFPSDQYAIESQVKFHGFSPEESIIEVHPRANEHTLRTEDILQKIEEHKDQLALILFGGINYYTGQFFDLEQITKKSHEIGAFAGFDLAHVAGNIPLQLHDWNVDFAVWCSYKYLNSGAGGTSGVFVHEKHGRNNELPRFAGWWGHDEKRRFLMEKGFVPMEGAEGWQLSNAQIIPMAIHRASLEIFEKAGFSNLRQKSLKITGFLEFLIQEFNNEQKRIQIEIITPKNSSERGCQLSLIVPKEGKKLFDFLTENGVIGDWREPDVIRIAPVPLYNSFMDIFKFYQLLQNYVKL